MLCLCGRNDRLRAKVIGRFGAEPRLRVMGFTDRMGDVLAAADVLVHSSAGLTVLEAIIRGCPVVSYGFGYGHVRASNAALERFELAQVARHESELVPDDRRARWSSRPEPDGSFARRPSTASLIMSDRAADRSRCRLGGCASCAPWPRWLHCPGRRRLDADHRARPTRSSPTSPTSARSPPSQPTIRRSAC